MNPTSALCLISSSLAARSSRSQGARARGVANGGVSSRTIARAAPRIVVAARGPSPIDGELTPAARSAVAARSRISRATSNCRPGRVRAMSRSCT